jgi:hypothetical protein
VDSFVGKNILHYHILEQIDQGGMSLVYKAEDTRLKRKVAIKFLPHHIAANSEERERFKIEAQASAALNYPNIATIFYIEEYIHAQRGKQSFIVMEYIHGQELKQKIQSGPLQIEEAVNIAINIADKLRLQLEAKDNARLSKRYTQNTKAYELYLNGRFYWNKRSSEGMKTALQYFEEAINVNPQYALAWTGISDTYVTGWGIYLGISSKIAIEKSKLAALKAIEIDNSLSETHTSLAAA